ncbi:MAG: right-handed parallel beta-helix repeat-containing protein [Opitutus sp.]|nr:right-handed parallel beta-helix repeat-containing protein [Opitutus sp.]MCS6246585.1 right-handed parallel beta-helix repeat-containing protein [Opitutus sp.]MCS6272731.1 right-handed parallel beta-helix repeat-containing protein [Opitutus sp.]MCS6276362.1 right-handed parallel beta-helix repeat-containing protein [Opitutus sp.]MCS6301990.1 right-handed parallel beta-helix repeat-containing protein [Opitutus sp.]
MNPRRAASFLASLALVTAAPAQTLFSTRFDALAAKPFATAAASPGASARASLEPLGTIDTYRGPRTGALVLRAKLQTDAAPGARVRVTIPAFPVTTTQTSLANLSLGFDLRVSVLRPVRVFIESVQANGVSTGTLTTVVVPPVIESFYRFTPDLADFKAIAGTFDPRAPAIRVSFEMADDACPFPLPRGEFSLVVDNLSYAAPALYVSPQGDNTRDGRTPATALATIQRAVGLALPGDSILLLGGTYVSADAEPLVRIAKAGEPDRWITLRAAPGQHPILRGNGWDIVSLNHNAAYIELRGLDVHGYSADIPRAAAMADGLLRKKDGQTYSGDPRMNTNGLALDSRKGTEEGGKAHHVRFINNIVREVPGGGISAIAGDHITVEGNTTRDNCHGMRYAGSGISLFRAWDFDTDTHYKMFVIGNRSSGNRCYIPWSELSRISDGNGIIIDDFINYQDGASDIPYEGRTLVQNNLVFNNGGSGIHTYAANHVDIVHNTAYHNAQSPELVWRQIWAGSRCKDVRLANNIHWAQKGRPLHTGMGRSKAVSYTRNLMFGDGDNGLADGGGLGTSPDNDGQAVVTGHLSGDPLLVAPSVDATAADFHLLPGSPAIDVAAPDHPGVPLTDLDGRWRDAAPDLGAYEFTK